MVRVLAIIALVGLAMAGEVAGAAPTDRVRLPVTVDPEQAPGDRSGSVVVEKGDHLWKISAQHLGEETADEEIAPYWREVIDVNTPHLRSGDPDLIYPGEIVELPRAARDLGSTPGRR